MKTVAFASAFVAALLAINCGLVAFILSSNHMPVRPQDFYGDGAAMLLSVSFLMVAPAAFWLLERFSR